MTTSYEAVLGRCVIVWTIFKGPGDEASGVRIESVLDVY